MSWRAAGSMFSRFDTLPIAAADVAIDYQGDVIAGKVVNQRLGEFDRAVLRVGDAKHDLARRVILLGERPQIFVKTGLGAMERLQDRDRGPLGRSIGNSRRAKRVTAHAAPNRYTQPGSSSSDGERQVHGKRVTPGDDCA